MVNLGQFSSNKVTTASTASSSSATTSTGAGIGSGGGGIVQLPSSSSSPFSADSPPFNPHQHQHQHQQQQQQYSQQQYSQQQHLQQQQHHQHLLLQQQQQQQHQQYQVQQQQQHHHHHQQQQQHHRATPPRVAQQQHQHQHQHPPHHHYRTLSTGSGGSRSRSNSPHPSGPPIITTTIPSSTSTTTTTATTATSVNVGITNSNSNSGGDGNNNNSNGSGTNPAAQQQNHPNSNAVSKFAFEYQGETLELRNVWAENVEEEMHTIREVVEKYPYVAMDTEFPGVVAKPVTETYSPDYHYRSLKVNVDLLNIIQLGLSFADEDGNFAPGCPCWQFNFRFDLDGDMFAQDSIDLLQKSGISFYDHARRGIDPLVFGELLMVSGLVLDDRVRWVSFHSGYDYGYLLKLLTTTDLPTDEKTFMDMLKLYFPTIYDIKYMTSLLDGHFMGGLQRLADDLGCQRLGAEHQAGSDSLLTMSTFFSLVRAKFMSSTTSSDGSPSSKADTSKFANELFGYGNNHTVRKGSMIHREASTGTANSVGSAD